MTDKIFDKETIQYLEGFGINPEEIKRIQREKLKKCAINTLRLIAEAIKDDKDFSTIESLTFHSAAGDGYGNNNTCINFGDIAGKCYDIEELFEELKVLSTKKESK